MVSYDDLNITQGQENVATYEVSKNGKKLFCSKCCTPFHNINERYPGLCMVHYGSLSENSSLPPTFNLYCESKLLLVDNISILKSF
ncbi:MAG: hypothetical protein GJU72_13135 [Acidithiobacillus ferriphilus]|nr:hypothetical protein [Acidithiobacillus ferriphilus]MBW9254434.1 hypothetical protein [Acidithiobacillus ferriphilus]